MTHSVRLLTKASVRIGIEDLKAFYTWRTWLFGWVLRIVFQVLFFSLLGRYVDQPGAVEFLLVGGAAVVAVLETMVIVVFTSFDRASGTLPLLVAAPGDYFLVVIFRNVNLVATGTATSAIALFTCSFALGVPLPYPQALLVIPVIALGAVSTFLFGLFLSSFVFRAAGGRWIMLNVGYMSLSALCGFVIPVGFWPSPLSELAEILPFTHALRALRDLLFHPGPAGQVLAQTGLELLVALGWLVLARVAFLASVERARRAATIDLSGA